MKELFKNAIVNNIGRLVAGLLFTLIVGAITSVLVEPVMKVVDLPNQVSEWQKKTDANFQNIEVSQRQFLSSVKKQSQTDSVIQLELEKLNSSHKVLQQEVSVIQAKIAIVRDELPVLHKRFNDIENTVNNLRTYSDFAYESPLNNNQAFTGRSQHYDKIRSRFPRLLYQDSLNRAQSNIAYQSPFNTKL